MTGKSPVGVQGGKAPWQMTVENPPGCGVNELCSEGRRGELGPAKHRISCETLITTRVGRGLMGLPEFRELPISGGINMEHG